MTARTSGRHAHWDTFPTGALTWRYEDEGKMRDSVPADWKRRVVRLTAKAMVPMALALVLVVLLPSVAMARPDPTSASQGSTWYLAEGSTAWGYSTYINIESPNDNPVTARVTLMDPSVGASGKGAVYRKDIVLPPMSQTVINAASMLPYTCDFSTKIECLQGEEIAVDRTMTWRGPGAASEEGHCSIGVTAPSDTWYLPEGSSNWGFETWTLVENPGDEVANIQLTYMTDTQGAKTLNKTIAPHSRATFSMAQDIGAADSSIKVTSDIPVIAERSVYRNNRREGSCSIGATAPSTRFFLAEGTTAWGFTTYVLVQNPGSQPAEVTLKCQTPQGPVTLPPFELEGRARKTVRLNEMPQVADRDVSTEVVSSSPIVAERSMYWTSSTGEACHDSIGMPAPHMRYYLPDGQTLEGRETWTMVENPNAQSVNIRVVYLSLNGVNIDAFQDTLAPGTRKAYRMNDRLPNGRASVAVESIDDGRPIVVERSMYWNERGAGTDTIGAYSDSTSD